MSETTTESTNSTDIVQRKSRRTRYVLVTAVAALFLAIYLLSPIRQVNDSAYSMMLSQVLIEHHSFRLDNYNIPRNPPKYREEYRTDGDIYQLDMVGDHIYYFFPPGSSVLSIPFVSALNLFGISAVAANGTYDADGEMRIEGLIAAILMSAFCVVVFLIAGLRLPNWLALVVTVAVGLGTQVWSTTSRAMYTDTWAVLLLTIVLYLIARAEFSGKSLKPVLMATLLSWTYFTAPVYSIHILAISVFILIYYRKSFVPLAMTGVLWLAGFVAWSWYNFHQLRPNYFKATRLRAENFGEALLGNLISPSRGLFVFVPCVLFVIYLTIRYWGNIESKRLVTLARIVFVLHLIVISAFTHWWGGHSYGPRFMTALIPWILLMAIEGLDAMRKARQGSGIGRLWRTVEIGAAVLCLAVSVFINARGAISGETLVWNSRPDNIDRDPARLWDWRYPQFMAGLVNPSPPAVFPTANPGLKIALDSPESASFLWFGWSDPEPGFRWTNAKQASIVFAAPDTSAGLLKLKLLPYLAGNRLAQQRVDIVLNDVRIQSLNIASVEAAEYEIRLPVPLVLPKNVLLLDLPDATAPSELGESNDTRQLGLRVEWIEFGQG